MDKKTIVVLIYTHIVFFGGKADTHTSCMEAYESFEDAFVALEEEFTSSINERIFRKENLVYADIDIESESCQSEIIYDDKRGDRNKDIFKLSVIDLVTK